VAIRTSAAKLATAQVPLRGEITLDHVAYFVPHIDNAAPAFAKLGFTLTPFSAQSHRLEENGPLTPAGTGNCCVMLQRGYLECLTPTADTPVASQLRAAMQRYVGVHSIIFGTSAPERDHARLAQQGFAPLPTVALQRPVEAPQGEDTARFAVVRVPPGTMPEGRIQFCHHLTPQLVWQPRWIKHANRAIALTGVMLCVEHPAEVASRYARFTGLQAKGAGETWHLDLGRGRLLFASPAAIVRTFSTAPPALPWIAGCVLASDSLEATRKCIVASGFAHGALGAQRFYALPPPGIGGIIVFEPPKGPALDFGANAA